LFVFLLRNAIADHRITIRAITVIDGPHTGGARLVVDKPELVKEVLARAGVTCTSTKCLALEMPTTPADSLASRGSCPCVSAGLKML